MALNLYDNPAKYNPIRKYQPLPVQELYTMAMNRQKEIDASLNRVNEQVQKFSEFSSPSDLDTSNYHAMSTDLVADIINEAADNPDLLTNSDWHRRANKVIAGLPYAKMARLRQGAKSLETYIENRARLQRDGLYKLEWDDYKDIKNYDTLNRGILDQLSPMEYKPMENIVMPLLKDLQETYLGSKDAYTDVYGVTEDHIRRTIDDNLDSLLNNPQFMRHMNDKLAAVGKRGQDLSEEELREIALDEAVQIGKVKERQFMKEKPGAGYLYNERIKQQEKADEANRATDRSIFEDLMNESDKDSQNRYGNIVGEDYDPIVYNSIAEGRMAADESSNTFQILKYDIINARKNIAEIQSKQQLDQNDKVELEKQVEKMSEAQQELGLLVNDTPTYLRKSRNKMFAQSFRHLFSPGGDGDKYGLSLIVDKDGKLLDNANKGYKNQVSLKTFEDMSYNAIKNVSNQDNLNLVQDMIAKSSRGKKTSITKKGGQVVDMIQMNSPIGLNTPGGYMKSVFSELHPENAELLQDSKYMQQDDDTNNTIIQAINSGKITDYGLKIEGVTRTPGRGQNDVMLTVGKMVISGRELKRVDGIGSSMFQGRYGTLEKRVSSYADTYKAVANDQEQTYYEIPVTLEITMTPTAQSITDVKYGNTDAFDANKKFAGYRIDANIGEE